MAKAKKQPKEKKEHWIFSIPVTHWIGGRQVSPEEANEHVRKLLSRGIVTPDNLETARENIKL